MNGKRKTRGALGFTSPGKGGGHRSGRTAEILAPPSTKKPRSKKSPCFIATACAEARGLPDDCYELELLRLFRREYVAKLPDGEAILDEYRRKAPSVVAAIGALDDGEAARAWEDLYERGVARAVALISNGAWDEAFEVYATLCRELEARFLAPERTEGEATGAPQ